MSRTLNYWCRKHFIKIQDRQIFYARDKIKDSITGSLNQDLQKSNISNLSETVPTCREHQTIGVGNISSRFKAVGSNSALFDSCPFWLVLFWFVPFLVLAVLKTLITGPTCREHQTIGVGNISSRFKTV